MYLEPKAIGEFVWGYLQTFFHVIMSATMGGLVGYFTSYFIETDPTGDWIAFCATVFGTIGFVLSEISGDG